MRSGMTVDFSAFFVIKSNDSQFTIAYKNLIKLSEFSVNVNGNGRFSKALTDVFYGVDSLDRRFQLFFRAVDKFDFHDFLQNIIKIKSSPRKGRGEHNELTIPPNNGNTWLCQAQNELPSLRSLTRILRPPFPAGFLPVNAGKRAVPIIFPKRLSPKMPSLWIGIHKSTCPN
ncbi:hypothetical protein SDC9_113649 [bioreactor metagenome]|uniref:Uncharacterized protein n=1 Tax=bioreactor metagenome TaxID=1076179 RepID=A0A645BNP5_9ZZZZ